MAVLWLYYNLDYTFVLRSVGMRRVHYVGIITYCGSCVNVVSVKYALIIELSFKQYMLVQIQRCHCLQHRITGIAGSKQCADIF